MATTILACISLSTVLGTVVAALRRRRTGRSRGSSGLAFAFASTGLFDLQLTLDFALAPFTLGLELDLLEPVLCHSDIGTTHGTQHMLSTGLVTLQLLPGHRFLALSARGFPIRPISETS